MTVEELKCKYPRMFAFFDVNHDAFSVARLVCLSAPFDAFEHLLALAKAAREQDAALLPPEKAAMEAIMKAQAALPPPKLLEPKEPLSPSPRKSLGASTDSSAGELKSKTAAPTAAEKVRRCCATAPGSLQSRHRACLRWLV